MLPRSDCATAGAGTVSATVATAIAIERLIAITASRVPCSDVLKNTLSVGPSSCGLEDVRIGVTDDRQPCRHAGAGEADAMPGLRGGVDDVALVSDEERHRSDLEFHLTLEDEPELRSGQMQVPQIVVSRRRLPGRIASDDVRDADVDVAAV